MSYSATSAGKRQPRQQMSDEAKRLVNLAGRVRFAGHFPSVYKDEKEMCETVLPILYKTFPVNYNQFGHYDGEDIAHQVMMKTLVAWRARNGDFSGPNDNFMSFVATIATNERVKMWRKGVSEDEEGRYFEDTILSDRVDDVFCDTSMAPERQVMKEDLLEEARDDLRAAINGLNEIDQQLIVGHYWQEKPIKVLAEETGLTPGNVKKRMTLARQEMKRIMTTSGLKFTDYLLDEDEDYQDYYNNEMDRTGQKPVND